MNEKDQSTRKAADQKREKKEYQTPVLEVHGNVNTLTLAGGSNGFDGLGGKGGGP